MTPEEITALKAGAANAYEFGYAKTPAQISSQSLQPAPTIAAPIPKKDTNDYQSPVAAGMGQMESLQAQMKEMQSASGGTATPEVTNLQNLIASFVSPNQNAPAYDAAYGTTDSSRAESVKSAEKEKQTTRSRVRAAQAEVAGIQAQIQSITDQRDAQVLQLEKTINEGSTGVGGAGALASGSFLNVRQQEINRQSAIKALPLQGLALAAQAKLMGLQGLAADAQEVLDSAQKKFDQAFELKISDNNRIYDSQKENASAIRQHLSTAEKARLDAVEKRQATDFSRANDAINFAQAQSTLATQNGQADMAMALTNLPKPNLYSKTFEADLQTYNQSVAAIQGQIKPKLTGQSDFEQAFLRDNGRLPTVNELLKWEKDKIAAGREAGAFSKTQLNKGASNAGVAIETFGEYSLDVKNFYVNQSPEKAQALRQTIVNVENGTQDVQEALDYINSKGLPVEVSSHLTDLINSVTPKPKQGFWSTVWRGLTDVVDRVSS